MAKVEGIKGVLGALATRLIQSRKDDVSVMVGYTQEYSIFVHENLEAKHKPGKQAKFLEQPAREMKLELKEIINKALKAKKTLEQALLLAGLKLQAASQRIVPVDTGALKNSAFTRVVKK
jgi:hypothetical protein